MNNNLVISKELKKLNKKKDEAVKKDNVIEVELINIEIDKELLKEQRSNLEKKLNEIKEVKSKKGKSAAVFKLKADIVGAKKLLLSKMLILTRKCSQ